MSDERRFGCKNTKKKSHSAQFCIFSSRQNIINEQNLKKCSSYQSKIWMKFIPVFVKSFLTLKDSPRHPC